MGFRWVSMSSKSVQSLNSTFTSPVFMEDSKFVDGVYKGYRVGVRLVREGGGFYGPYHIRGPQDVYAFLEELASVDREVFYCLHLDQRHQIISCEEVSRGTLSEAQVHPREVYKAAILSSAASIIVAHNHPSGDPCPSEHDKEVVHRLCRVGRLVGIPLLDSVIIGDGTYYSMKDHGEVR